MTKQKIDVVLYRKSEFFERNQKIWNARYHKELSVKQIAKLFNLSLDEIKGIFAIHKQFYKQEYD